MARMKSKADLVEVDAQKLIKEYWQTIQGELLIHDWPRNRRGRLRTDSEVNNIPAYVKEITA